jgi:hypothetical protein
MIAKGNFHGGGVKLAAYLVKGHPGERAELVEMRGFAASDLRDAFRQEDIKAREATKAETAFFHCYTRLAAGERLTRKQWIEIADREEKRLGFTGQPRAISFHTDRATGDSHMHIAWSRIAYREDGRLVALDPGLFKNKLKELSREVEKDFALREVTSERAADARTRATDRAEFEESRRLDTDLKDVRNVIHDCLQHSDNGRALNAALLAQGMVLANGDRRDCFVVVDHAGGHHALNKKLTGLTLEEMRGRLSDIDRAALPSVEEAKERQARHSAAREARREHEQPAAAKTPGHPNTPSDGHARTAETPRNAEAEKNSSKRELGKTAGEIRTAWAITRHRGAESFTEEIEKRGLILVYVTPEQAKASERAQAFAKAINRQNRALREGFAVVDQRGTVTRIDQRVTGDLRAEIDKRLGGIDRADLMSVGDARQVMRDANRAAWQAEKEKQRAIRRMNAPLGKTAGDIRTAWTLTQTAGQLEEALAARGMTIARVTAEEAYASERGNAFAKEIGNAARVLKEGELVVVNGFGSTYRLDERTTGNFRPEIDKRLAGVDAGSLLSVTDAATAMHEASRASYAEAARIEREKARPATKIETVIADALKSTMTGHDFGAAIDKAGLTIARATPADLLALDALRRDDERAAATGLEASGRHLARLEVGEFAAVNRAGDVFRLNPYKLDFAEIEQRLADTQRRMPSVVEARAGHEVARKEKAALWEQRTSDNAARRIARDEAKDAQRTLRGVGKTAYRETGKVERSAEKTAGRTAGIVGRGVLGALAGFFKLFDLFPAKPPSPEQQKRNYYAAQEQQATDDLAAKKEANVQDVLRQIARDDQERERRRRERGGYDDDYGRGRER